MAIPWRTSAEVFARVLRRHGAAPEAVTKVSTAWAAFAEFLQIPIDGIEGASNDGDGFIVQWGRNSWNRNGPALSFGRLLGVCDTDDRRDPFWQPEYWMVELDLTFAESPVWDELDGTESDTGFDHYELGEPRRAALEETREYLEAHPQLSVVWRTSPIHSAVTLERAD